MTARLLDKKIGGKWPYQYVPSAQSDIRLTFERERRRLAAEAKAQQSTVVQLKKGKK